MKFVWFYDGSGMDELFVSFCWLRLMALKEHQSRRGWWLEVIVLDEDYEMLYVEISFGQLVDYEVTLGYSQVHSKK